MQFVLKSIVSLKTWYLYNVIESSNKWDSKFDLISHTNAVSEITFWKENIIKLNRRNISCHDWQSDLKVHSDASDYALGVVLDNGFTCHRKLTNEEQIQSSTYREIIAILHGLRVFIDVFKGKKVDWFVDNSAASSIVKKGSAKLYLHKIAVEIYGITSTNDVHLNVSWVPRELNTTADLLSKYVDVDDWEITMELFEVWINCGVH